MTSQELGVHFENITKEFFVFLFEKLGFTILKDRIQFSGSQNGFDVLIEVSKNYQSHKVFIECKNYTSDLDIGNILKKALDIKKNHSVGPRDLFIAINSKSNFKNSDIEERSSETFSNLFTFKSMFLDKTNGVMELFALKKNLYQQLYGNEVEFEIDEDKIINRFRETLFSRSPFKTIELTEENRVSLIGDIGLPDHYIQRTFSEEPDNLSFYFLPEKEDSYLSKLVLTHNRIFVLGNPGTGKSTELKKLAMDIFSDGPETELVPIFRNLRDFTSTDSIGDFLNFDITDFNNIIFIFDGIDEIADIEYFKSKLIQFIKRNQLPERTFRYVISCRTNIYKSWVADFKGFTAFYLRNLTPSQTFELLRSHCGDIIDNLDFTDSIREFLNSPFHVEVLGDYIKSHGGLPTNNHFLWENYIEQRISLDRHEKLRKIGLIPVLITKYSRKMALINELMKTNVMKEDDIFSMTNGDTSDFNEFLKNPLLEVQINSTNRSFSHRNIQEYFAATVITSKDIGEIIEFIQVGDSGKTHPSLFNTITFLLGLLPEDNEKYKGLVEWLLEHQFELLFRADGNRLNNTIRSEVFQKHFKSSCIEDTLWIGSSKIYDVKEIAMFGNIPENYHYLIKIIKLNTAHERAVISALNLLGFISIPEAERENLKQLLIESFNCLKVSIPQKSYMLGLVYQQSLAIGDNDFFEEIFRIFKDEKSRQINSKLLYLLKTRQNIDEYFDYIHAEFLRANNFVPREDEDNVNSSNDAAVEELILKFESKVNLLKILKYYFNIDHRIRLDGMFASSMSDKLIALFTGDREFVLSFLELVCEVFEFRLHDGFLEKLIEDANLDRDVIAFVLNKAKFTDVRYFIADIISIDSIGMVGDHLIKTKIDDIEVEKFRNTVGNIKNRSLAVTFHQKMEKAGYKFSEPPFTQIDAEKWWEKVKIKTMTGFNLLFHKDKLVKRYKAIFKAHDNLMDNESYRAVNRLWYKDNGHGSVISPALSLLGRLIRNQPGEKLEYKKLKELLENEDTRIEQIVRSLKNNKNNSSWELMPNKDQLSILEKWCARKVKTIDFNKLLTPLKEGSYQYGKHFMDLKKVLYLFDIYKFKLPEEFLLDSIKYFEQVEGSFKYENFTKFKESINSDQAFDNRVSENLMVMDLENPVPYFHIKHVLENQSLEIFHRLEEYFISKSSRYNEEKNIAEYFRIIKAGKGESEAEKAMLHLCNDIEDRLFWIAVNLLCASGLQKEFCIEKAMEYLNSPSTTFSSEALTVLFGLEHEEAIPFLIDILEKDPKSSIRFMNTTGYSCIKNHAILVKFYDVCYSPSDDRYESHLMTSFYRDYIGSLSKKNKETYFKVKEQLEKIKIKLMEGGKDLFHINMLLTESKNSYLNSMSKALSFEKALERVNKSMI